MRTHDERGCLPLMLVAEIVIIFFIWYFGGFQAESMKVSPAPMSMPEAAP